VGFIIVLYFAKFVNKLNEIEIVLGISTILIAAFVYDYIQKTKLKRINKKFSSVFEIINPDLNSEFNSFFGLYFENKKTFYNQYKSILKNYDFFDFENLKPIELFYIFCDSRKLLSIIDWRGEENDKEIERFIENLHKTEIIWSNTIELRREEQSSKDSDYIKMLFQTIQKDISILNLKILLLEMDWDSYVYTVVDQDIAYKILHLYPKEFMSINDLR
jgi:hypothetical protein